MLALTSPTGGGRSVGIVRSRTKDTEFFFIGIVSLNVVMWHEAGRDCFGGCFRMCSWRRLISILFPFPTESM